MSEARVSIITACFNSQVTIGDAIESILAQSYSNIQYIIIDGGSNDGTLAIIKEYEPKFNKDSFIFISEPDKGIADAWNKGLKLAKGDIIGLLNADDYYETDSVKKAVYSIDTKEDIITYGICKFIDVNKEVIKINDLTFDETKLSSGFGFMHTTCFIPKKVYELVGDFNVTLKYAMDSEFLIRCHKKGVVFKRIDNITYMRTGGVSDKNRIISYRYYQKELKKQGYRISPFDYPTFYLKQKIKSLFKVPFFKRVFMQLLHLVIFFINVFYNFLPFFFLRKQFLRVIGIKLGNKTYIHPWVTFFNFGNLIMGNNSVINRSCYIDNRRKITIGNNVSIGHNTKIYTLGHDINDPYFRNKGNNVVIEDYACIFTNVLIMPGVHIHKGAVVYSGAVVTKDVNEYEVVGGNPAKVIGKREKDLRYNLNHGYWKAL